MNAYLHKLNAEFQALIVDDNNEVVLATKYFATEDEARTALTTLIGEITSTDVTNVQLPPVTYGVKNRQDQAGNWKATIESSEKEVLLEGQVDADKSVAVDGLKTIVENINTADFDNVEDVPHVTEVPVEGS